MFGRKKDKRTPSQIAVDEYIADIKRNFWEEKHKDADFISDLEVLVWGFLKGYDELDEVIFKIRRDILHIDGVDSWNDFAKDWNTSEIKIKIFERNKNERNI